MAGYSIQRNGFLTFKTMMHSFIKDLKDNGFTLINPTALVTTPAGSETSTATLEAGPTVNTVTNQAWRIRIECVSDIRVNIYAGTSLQLDSSGLVAPSNKATTGTDKQGQLFLDNQTGNGFMGDKEWSLPTTSPLLLSGTTTVGTSLPLAYQLSISTRGIAACFWSEGSEEFGNRFSWFVIQRPSHPTNGAPLITGKCPVFCIFSNGGGGPTGTHPSLVLNKTGIKKFVVREADINTTSSSKSAVTHTVDSNLIMNSNVQTSFTEDGKYIINFPSGLNTDRYVYVHEMDMIAFTSADVVPPFSSVKLAMYGETAYPPGVTTPTDPCAKLYTREYMSLNANGPYNTGMRLLILVNGGSVTKSLV